MSLTYTRKELRDRVDVILRDPGNGKFSITEKNRMIGDIHRDFVQRTQCYRNVLVFSLASAAADGVILYDRNGNTPTITRVDVGSQNHYTISGCNKIDSINRWVRTTADYDGTNTIHDPVDQYLIDAYGLTGYTMEVSSAYQQLDSPGTFRLLPQLNSDGYPVRYEVRYREDPKDMISDDRSPADSTAIHSVGTGAGTVTVSGTGLYDAYYDLTIVAEMATNPNTFTVSKNGTVGATVNCATTATSIGDGIYVAWDLATGHTAGDVWRIYTDDPRVPCVPLKYRAEIISGVAAAFLMILDDQRAQSYLQLYERAVATIREDAKVLNASKGRRMLSSYTGAGA